MCHRLSDRLRRWLCDRPHSRLSFRLSNRLRDRLSSWRRLCCWRRFCCRRRRSRWRRRSGRCWLHSRLSNRLSNRRNSRRRSCRRCVIRCRVHNDRSPRLHSRRDVDKVHRAVRRNNHAFIGGRVHGNNRSLNWLSNCRSRGGSWRLRRRRCRLLTSNIDVAGINLRVAAQHGLIRS